MRPAVVGLMNRAHAYKHDAFLHSKFISRITFKSSNHWLNFEANAILWMNAFATYWALLFGLWNWKTSCRHFKKNSFINTTRKFSIHKVLPTAKKKKCNLKTVNIFLEKCHCLFRPKLETWHLTYMPRKKDQRCV